jgi:hypothetical protein
MYPSEPVVGGLMATHSVPTNRSTLSDDEFVQMPWIATIVAQLVFGPLVS